MAIPLAPGDPSQQTDYGFEAYLTQFLAKAGGLQMSGSDNKAGFVVPRGAWKGKSMPELIAAARENYSRMSPQQRQGFVSTGNNRDIRDAPATQPQGVTTDDPSAARRRQLTLGRLQPNEVDSVIRQEFPTKPAPPANVVPTAANPTAAITPKPVATASAGVSTMFPTLTAALGAGAEGLQKLMPPISGLFGGSQTSQPAAPKSRINSGDQYQVNFSGNAPLGVAPASTTFLPAADPASVLASRQPAASAPQPASLPIAQPTEMQRRDSMYKQAQADQIFPENSAKNMARAAGNTAMVNNYKAGDVAFGNQMDALKPAQQSAVMSQIDAAGLGQSEAKKTRATTAAAQVPLEMSGPQPPTVMPKQKPLFA